MNGFFHMDGPFSRFGNLLADLMILSILWILCSLPLVTIGSSTTALFYVSTRRISNKEGYVFRDFFKSFAQNFKQATLVWLLFLGIGWVLFFNIQHMEAFGSWATFLYPLQLFLLLELIFVGIFMFPLIARFEMGLKELLKTAFFMANRHLLTSFLCLFLAGGLVFLSVLTAGLMIFAAAGLYSFAASYFIMRIFKKYRPEIDADATGLGGL